MTASGRANESAGLSAIGTSFVVTIAAVMVVPNGMSWAATTMAVVVGAAGVPVPEPLLLVIRMTPTNATTARNRPISRMSRLLRFKVLLPGLPGDRWHHSSIARWRRDYTKGLGRLGGFGQKPSASRHPETPARKTEPAKTERPPGLNPAVFHERGARWSYRRCSAPC